MRHEVKPRLADDVQVTGTREPNSEAKNNRNHRALLKSHRFRLMHHPGIHVVPCGGSEIH
jgi:hypothetical protein